MQGHGGNIFKIAKQLKCSPEEIMDFSASINPAGPPDFIRSLLSRTVEQLVNYPDPNYTELIDSAASYFKVATSMICVGNGSNELIYAIPRALHLKRAVIAAPAYIDYEKACSISDLEVNFVNGDEHNTFVPEVEKLGAELNQPSLVFIGHPGNPAGTAMQPDAIRYLAAKHRDSIFVIDEAFSEFAEADISLLPEVPENVIVLRSMTKFYAVPGLRLGLAVGAPELIEQIKQHLPDWSVNTFAQKFGVEVLNAGDEYRKQTIDANIAAKEKMIEALHQLRGVKVFPGLANFLLLKLPKKAAQVRETLLRTHHIAVRDCSNFVGLDENYIRVAVKLPEQNIKLVSALAEVLGCDIPTKFNIKLKKRKPSLMLQGTCSNAGKSVLTAAFCRILLQDGYQVAPFKSQNMALNSYVTTDGCEMGRAQVVQAEACRLDPDVRMNPVLLKPSTDTGSQVIFMGQPIGNMRVKEYFNYKRELFGKVKAVYDSLEKDYDAIVLEGAGSPGEMNLKDSDIVNMNMARYAQSPVLLAGDIDRGGVYASFIGTVDTFAQWERDLLAGFLVNRFRGDATLLDPAHKYVEDYTGKPVLGVIPYIHNLGLPEEDSVSFSFIGDTPKDPDALDVVLVGLPHIANFTDFAPFDIEPDMNVRKVRSPADFGNPDVVILPGSKNVIGDLEAIRANGLADKISEAVANGSWFIGICGGLQMAGNKIYDPNGLESDTKELSGFGFLPLETELKPKKNLSRTSALWEQADLNVSGYEIHHGSTVCADEKLISIVSDKGVPVGFAADRIWLTYLHGVFDDDAFRREFIDIIRRDTGRAPLRKICTTYDTEDALNRLADTVREGVDMKHIYKVMGL
ncbi:MAG: cobyric acid synthase [Lentisphaerae bacterium]|nr:cobyric acid synthase [Lentisphaerota bacterium]MCP4101987.1 cobyric acid synthase [Lentisphaerota bacterium]